LIYLFTFFTIYRCSWIIERRWQTANCARVFWLVIRPTIDAFWCDSCILQRYFRLHFGVTVVFCKGILDIFLFLMTYTSGLTLFLISLTNTFNVL